MNWLPVLLQSVLKIYAQVQITQKTAMKAKEFAVQSGIMALGGLIALLFALAATVMVFVDLGNQIESHNGLHFSGMMLSAIFLTILGLFAFGICFMLAKYFLAREKLKNENLKAQEKESLVNQYAPLINLAEEFLKQLVEKTGQKEQP